MQGHAFRAVTLMTGKKKKSGCYFQCVWVGGWATRGGKDEEREAGRRQGLPALSPASACLDKTHRTCGGISMRHHTWRKRQLNPAPSTVGPGSTKSSQHLEWISGDTDDFTAPSRALLTLPWLKNAQWKVVVKIKHESHRGFLLINKFFFSLCTVSHLLGIMLLCCW